MDYNKIVSNIIAKINEEPNEFSHYNALYAVCENISDVDEKYKATNLLKECCTKGIFNKVKIAEKLSELFRETLLLEARGLRFDSYMQYIELNREPSKRFWLPRRKQLLPVVDAIQDLILILRRFLLAGNIKSLPAIFMLFKTNFKQK